VKFIINKFILTSPPAGCSNIMGRRSGARCLARRASENRISLGGQHKQKFGSMPGLVPEEGDDELGVSIGAGGCSVLGLTGARGGLGDP
jgi:hypothetical protein